MNTKKEGIGNLFDLPATAVPGVQGISKRVVFGPDNDWDDYVMRCFTLEKGAKVPEHSHDWSHYVLVLQGEGRLEIFEESRELKPMTWVHIPESVRHSFAQTKNEPFVFLCIVPAHGDVAPSQSTSQR